MHNKWQILLRATAAQGLRVHRGARSHIFDIYTCCKLSSSPNNTIITSGRRRACKHSCSRLLLFPKYSQDTVENITDQPPRTINILTSFQNKTKYKHLFDLRRFLHIRCCFLPGSGDNEIRGMIFFHSSEVSDAVRAAPLLATRVC